MKKTLEYLSAEERASAESKRKETAKRNAMKKAVIAYNQRVFDDTIWRCENIQEVTDAIAASREKQQVIKEGDALSNVNSILYPGEANVVFSGKSSLEAAAAYKGQHVCVLNAASFTVPGGSKVLPAQEESLVRATSLYKSLATPQCMYGFYLPHRTLGNALYNDDCIYSPGVMVLKNDEGELLNKPYLVDILSCAAPNLAAKPNNKYNIMPGAVKADINKEDLLKLLVKRFSRILALAHANGAEVLVLTAIGCGVYKNDPVVSANAWKQALSEYTHRFKTVEFAILSKNGVSKNLNAFLKQFGVYS